MPNSENAFGETPSAGVIAQRFRFPNRFLGRLNPPSLGHPSASAHFASATLPGRIASDKLPGAQRAPDLDLHLPPPPAHQREHENGSRATKLRGVRCLHRGGSNWHVLHSGLQTGHFLETALSKTQRGFARG